MSTFQPDLGVGCAGRGRVQETLRVGAAQVAQQAVVFDRFDTGSNSWQFEAFTDGKNRMQRACSVLGCRRSVN